MMEQRVLNHLRAGKPLVTPSDQHIAEKLKQELGDKIHYTFKKQEDAMTPLNAKGPTLVN